MDLNEIEAKADELLAEVLGEEHASRAEHAARKLRCLREAAHIKALRDSRAEHNVAVDLRQRELAAMEAVAENMPAQYPLPERPRCGHRWQWSDPFVFGASKDRQMHYETCTLPPEHVGPHRNEVTGVAAVTTGWRAPNRIAAVVRTEDTAVYVRIRLDNEDQSEWLMIGTTDHWCPTQALPRVIRVLSEGVDL